MNVSTNLRFGDFVKDKRNKKEIKLKAIAKKLNLSIAYWSDIENNRRYPITNKLDVVIKTLGLSPEEQNLLYDLAGKERKEVSPDLLQYIMDLEVSPYVRVALRKAQQYEATIEDWKRITEALDQKYKEKIQQKYKNELTSRER